LDLETSLLLTQMALEDIEDLLLTHRQGRLGLPLSDEEFSLQAQAESLRSAIMVIEDSKLAASLDEALHLDKDHLNNVRAAERIALHDHNADISLLHQLKAQTELEQEEAEGSGEEVEEEVSSTDSSDEESDNDYGTVDLYKIMPSVIIIVSCTSCTDTFDRSTCLKTICDHYYCSDCVITMATSCVKDESLYPLKCCKNPLDNDDITAFLEGETLDLFDSKTSEYDVPAKDRVYCQKPSCSTFLGAARTTELYMQCSQCNTSTCLGCRQISHPGDSCSENSAIAETKELAKKEHWQTCPSCSAIVELHFGCHHMTCRCGAQFCYVCATPWRGCTCPQWEEARLQA